MSYGSNQWRLLYSKGTPAAPLKRDKLAIQEQLPVLPSGTCVFHCQPNRDSEWEYHEPRVWLAVAMWPRSLEWVTFGGSTVRGAQHGLAACLQSHLVAFAG